MVQFSIPQMILTAVLGFLAVAIPTAMLYLAGRRIPPALTCEGRKAGFGGSLLILEATIVLSLFYWVIFTAIDLAQASRFITYRVDVPAWQILSPLVPDFIFIILFAWVGLRLVFGRKPRVQAEAIAIIWALGPVAGILSGLLYKDGFAWSDIAFSGAYAAVATFYLVLSDRVQLTYGTARGRALKPLRAPVKASESK